MDPQSTWTAKANKRMQFGDGLNYLIDIEKAVFVEVEATLARTYDEVAAAKRYWDRTEKRFDPKPKRHAAVTASSAGWSRRKKIAPRLPMSLDEDGTG